MLVTYGSLRQILPTSTFSVASLAGGAIPAGTYNIRIQGRNRAGRNLLSDPVSITCAANSKISVTLNSGIRVSGEDLFRISISYETTGNATDARLLAEWEARESDQVTFKPLPATVQITQLAPTGELTYLASTSDDGGCDKEITDLADNAIISPPPYPGNNVRGTPIAMWLNNGLTEDDGADEPQGSTIFLQAAVNGSTVDENGNAYGLRLKDKLIVRIEGLVRRSTGIIDTSIAGETIWDGVSPISMPVAVPRGYTVAVSLILKFASIAIPKGAGFAIYPDSHPPYGKPSGSLAFGDFVSDVGDKALVVPEQGGAWRRLSGLVTVSGYESPAFGEQIFTGLLADTANQKLTINAQSGGDMFVRTGTIESMEAIRAIASTVGGTYKAIGTTTITTTAIGSIQVTVDYPCNSSGRGTIRGDYPDTKIAGNIKGAFNPPRLKVWVEFGGGIWELPNLVSVTPAPTQTFLVDTIAGATQVPYIPFTAASDFCLFDYTAIAGVSVAGVGQLATGSYKVWVAYHFPSTNNREITSLAHSGTGVLKELGSQTNVARLDQTQSFSKAQRGNSVQLSISTDGIVQIDCDASNTFVLQLTKNVVAVQLINVRTDTRFDLHVVQNGAFTITGWPASTIYIAWIQGVAPTITPTTGKEDLLSFSTWDGYKIKGVYAQGF